MMTAWPPKIVNPLAAVDRILIDGDPKPLMVQDLLIAQKAVCIHAPQEWPTGTFCRNCRGRWPCRLYEWGARVLAAFGWHAHDIEELIERVEAGFIPWDD